MMWWNGEVVEAIEPTVEQVEEFLHRGGAGAGGAPVVSIERPAEDAAGEGAGEQESSEWEDCEDFEAE
jgi:hypothetical protein